jgi:hypothetical protein
MTIIDARRRTPPPPPSSLSTTQRELWADFVSVMRPDMVTRASIPILVALCRHVQRHDRLESLIAKAWRDEGRLKRLLSLARAETAAVLGCCRALRISPQARFRAQRNDVGPPPSYYDLMREQREGAGINHYDLMHQDRVDDGAA